MNELQKNDSDELLRLLFRESSLEHFMRGDVTDLLLPKFSVFITELSSKRNEAPERIIKRANIERSYGHQIFRGIRNPSRDTVLQLAFGFEADYDLTQMLLKVARKAALSPHVKRDVVIIFCLQHQYSFVDTQLALDEYKLPQLGGQRYE